MEKENYKLIIQYSVEGQGANRKVLRFEDNIHCLVVEKFLRSLIDDTRIGLCYEKHRIIHDYQYSVDRVVK